MAETPARISCVIHTRNSAATLGAALRTARWTDELLVVDMESSDGTVEMARGAGALVVPIPVADRVDGVRNHGVSLAAGEWILVLDSDEWLADDAEAEVRGLVAARGREFDAFALPRFNTIGGQVMTGSLWYPDHQVRLFRKGCVRWSDTHHRAPEVVTGPSRLLELTPPDCLHLHHANYESLRHVVAKQLSYALTDSYDPDPSRFAFAEYVARAHRQLALRSDPGADGDLSRALALVMAWDSVVRGLLHWESLSPRPPLPPLEALPPMPPGRMPGWEVRLRRWLLRQHPLRLFLHRVRAKLLSLAGR